MYANGTGVLQDYVGAYMWYNLASANGLEDAGKRRDEIAAKMTPVEVSEAQSRARVCLASNYQDCD
jgi:TPR repeat protein